MLAGGLMVTTAACGGDEGGGSKNKVASGGGANAADGGGNAGSDKKDADKGSQREQMIRFAGCMREHGIDMPDPEGEDGAMGMTMALPAGGDTTKADEAYEACRQFQPESDFDPGDPAYKEYLARHGECLRAEGLDMPDAGGGMAMAIDPNDEKTMKALETCDKKVPRHEPEKKK